MTMETLFVLTHAVMLTCLIVIIGISIVSTADDTKIKNTSLLGNYKPLRINAIYISRIAMALLNLFLR